MSYRLEKDTINTGGRGIAIIHIGDKETWIGSISEDPVDFHQNDHCCLDMADLLEVVRVANLISEKTFEAVYNEAADFTSEL